MVVCRLSPSVSSRSPRQRAAGNLGLALLVALSALAGCSGGSGSSGSVGFSCTGTSRTAICLESCNLGCSNTGCARTDIAQNQIVILNFSEAVDPNSVSPSSIRFRTASGDQPVGEFFTNGNRVEFVPTLAISGGQTFFGFAAGETYTMTIPGGADQTSVVRGTSGKPFASTLVCTLQSTLGIVDVNGVAPRATMVVPTPSQVNAAPRDTEIVLEFNEMIDATPFLGGTQSPVVFTVRRNRETSPGSEIYECNPNSAPQILAGTQSLSFDAGRGISVLSFRPVQDLPGNICVEVNITDQVADLSGRPAQPQTLSFRTIKVPLVDQDVTEEFDTEDKFDADASAARWSNTGFLEFAQIGGDGRHGPFSLAFCQNTGQTEGTPPRTVWTLSTENTVIPATNTTTGAPIAVSDGRFFFSRMVVPSDVRLRFIGNVPPIVTVAGRLDVLGDIDVKGFSNLTNPLTSQIIGQAGAAAGCGGGAGGKGGDKINSTQATTTGATAANNGVAGSDARALVGHGYATSMVGTGGRGSVAFPLSGLNAHLYYGQTTGVPYTPSAAAGGGGGGFLLPGAQGLVTNNNHPEPGLNNLTASAATADTIVANGVGIGNPSTFPWFVNRFAGRQLEVLTGAGAGQIVTVVSNNGLNGATFTVTPPWTSQPAAGSTFRVIGGPAPLAIAMGPAAPGGAALQLLPFPAPTGFTRSSEHFLVGGSGGGGSGSNACIALGIGTADRWVCGAGGGGGGGAVALRAGSVLRIGPAAKLLAFGGNGVNTSSTTASLASAAPAGGGSGGSIVLQSGGTVDITGAIDVRGGLGGLYSRATLSPAPPTGASVQIAGGNGANGFVRLEAPTQPALSVLATMQPAATADNVGVLTERDSLVLCTSKYYSTGQVFGPEFARYEIHAIVDGVPVVLSDDPAVSTQTASVGAPVRVLFQAAQLDLVTLEPQQTGPWRAAVHSTPAVTGIDADAFNGFRFKVFADYGQGQVITIDKIVVVYRI